MTQDAEPLTARQTIDARRSIHHHLPGPPPDRRPSGLDHLRVAMPLPVGTATEGGTR
ncbi:hypothetical protein ACFRH6_15785 [Streptomyces sp. NPDC056749]|uniref:hypothetical protein n=1 Tax=Streptomyces sp. NPDC056749 TaxID=3345936 RepID=UPI00368734A5